MIIAIIVAVALVALTVMACCKVSGDCARKEENNPCDSCLRWPECNGVDEDCPWRAE